MINRQQIYQWWDLFKSGNMLTEIRIIDGRKTYSGYFTDVETLIRSVEPFSNDGHAQIYYTINCIKDACSDRVQRDKIILVGREPTTSDADIEGRTYVFIDLDPKRPSGVSSSDEELEYAHRKAVDVYRYLLGQGFNEPIICKSGNGYHIYVPCHIIASDETTEIVKKFLQTLSLLFSDDKVEIDEKVYNLARISKLPGTIARKGSNTSKRPWRMSEIIKYPDEIKPTDIAYFKKIAGMYPNESHTPNKYNGYSTERFDLVAFLQKHGVGYREVRVAGGTKYLLDHCPFNDQHKHKDAAIFQRDNGAIGFICFHSSCSGKTWRDVRLLFDPHAYDNVYQKDKYKPHQKQTLPPIIKTEDKGDIWLRMSDIRRQPFSISDFIPSGIVELDRKGVGFKRGMVSVWTGKRGCGKSSMLNMIILNAVQHSYKSALWTGELTGDMVKQWLYLQAAGKQHNRRYKDTDYYMTDNDVIDDIDEWTHDNLFLFNNKYGDNFSQIEEQIKTLHKEHHIDQVLLDNLMVLDIRMLEENKYDRQAILMQRLEDLSKELNIHIHLVAHPHKSIGYIRIDNVGGSGDITNKADNVFVMSRVNNDFKASAPEYLDKMVYDDIIRSECSNVIEIGKFRSKGTLMGDVVKLWFEPESNRLKNFPAESIVYGWDKHSINIPDTLSFYDEPTDLSNVLDTDTSSEECPF